MISRPSHRITSDPLILPLAFESRPKEEYFYFFSKREISRLLFSVTKSPLKQKEEDLCLIHGQDRQKKKTSLLVHISPGCL